MSDLVENPDDRFSPNQACLFSSVLTVCGITGFKDIKISKKILQSAKPCHFVYQLITQMAPNQWNTILLFCHWLGEPVLVLEDFAMGHYSLNNLISKAIVFLFFVLPIFSQQVRVGGRNSMGTC